MSCADRSFGALLLPIFLCLASLVCGCSQGQQQDLIDKFTPKEEAAIARQLIEQLVARDYAAVEAQLDPKLRTPELRSTLEKLASAIPAGEPRSAHTVGAYTNRMINNGAESTSYNLTFEYEYPDRWLLATVYLVRQSDQLLVAGLHIDPMKESLETTNRFSLDGKSALHYFVLAMCAVVPLFIVYAFIVCILTPIAKRKWLWCLFILLGIAQFSLNWTDGSWTVKLIQISLLGAGFWQSAPAAPLILMVSVPVGAIVFLFRRRALAERAAALRAVPGST